MSFNCVNTYMYFMTKLYYVKKTIMKHRINKNTEQNSLPNDIYQ